MILVLSAGIGNGQIKLDHPFDCYETSLNSFKSVEDIFVETFTIEATLENEIQWGDSTHFSLTKEFSLLNDQKLLTSVNKILKNLSEQIPKFENPTDHSNYGRYEYSLFLLDTNVINAFTSGQRIYLTKGIIDFCQNDDEIAMIIAHEIAHNELGHINEKIAKFNSANDFFGETGGTLTFIIGNLLRTPFGQLEEGHCDLFGMDIALKAGYKGCAVVELWDRMNKNEDEKSFIDLFLSHPYSGDRANCARYYIDNTYGLKCE